MSETIPEAKLDIAANNLRFWQNEMKHVEGEYKNAKEVFKNLLTEVMGEGKQEFVASDGFRYGRTVAEVGGSFDFERFLAEHPEIAKRVSIPMLVPEWLEQYAEENPDMLPVIQGYAIPGHPQERLLPITEAKTEDE